MEPDNPRLVQYISHPDAHAYHVSANNGVVVEDALDVVYLMSDE